VDDEEGGREEYCMLYSIILSKTFRYPLAGTVVLNRAGVGFFSFGPST
jgi:hypothetical protein